MEIKQIGFDSSPAINHKISTNQWANHNSPSDSLIKLDW